MKKYLIAQETNGRRMRIWADCQLIEAESPEQACEIYNQKEKCIDYKGVCLGEYDEFAGTVNVPISILIGSCCMQKKEKNK